jgi:hypothetical protein
LGCSSNPRLALRHKGEGRTPTSTYPHKHAEVSSRRTDGILAHAVVEDGRNFETSARVINTASLPNLHQEPLTFIREHEHERWTVRRVNFQATSISLLDGPPVRHCYSIIAHRHLLPFSHSRHRFRNIDYLSVSKRRPPNVCSSRAVPIAKAARVVRGDFAQSSHYTATGASHRATSMAQTASLRL